MDHPEHPPDGDEPVWPFVLQAVVLGVVAGCAWWGATRTTGVVHVGLEVLLVAAGAYVGYLVLLLLVVLVVVLHLKRVERPRPEGRRDRWPLVTRVVAVLVVPSWAVTAWWSGYDAAEWASSGVSAVLAVAVLLLVFRRPRRRPVPDGPDGRQHRSMPPS